MPVNDIPYIVVDNVRIAPLRRVPDSGWPDPPASGSGGDPPFGIVDRVTLSVEGLQRSRQPEG